MLIKNPKPQKKIPTESSYLILIDYPQMLKSNSITFNKALSPLDDIKCIYLLSFSIKNTLNPHYPVQ